jgi:hypothetical protein
MEQINTRMKARMIRELVASGRMQTKGRDLEIRAGKAAEDCIFYSSRSGMFRGNSSLAISVLDRACIAVQNPAIRAAVFTYISLRSGDEMCISMMTIISLQDSNERAEAGRLGELAAAHVATCHVLGLITSSNKERDVISLTPEGVDALRLLRILQEQR